MPQRRGNRLSSRRWITLAIAICFALATPAFGQSPFTASPEAVDAAMQKAVTYLYDQQNADGTWEESPAPIPPAGRISGLPVQSVRAGQWGGRTALAVYALLAAGENPSDERLKPAIAFLKSADIRGTYALGLRLMALSYLPGDEATKTTIARDAGALLATVKTQGNAAGHYDYNVSYRNDPQIYSHSRSQYGILGVWAAARSGYEVPLNYWRLVDTGWRRNQDPSGGWRYMHPDDAGRFDVTPGMTAAGVASLFLTNDHLLGARAAGCNGNWSDPALEAGLTWLAEHFELFDPANTYERDFPYITLYNLERIGAASGLRHIGGHDWYARGAAWLIAAQRTNGSFGASGGGIDRILSGVPDTAYALLFFARGRSPVIANKLVYSLQTRRGDMELGPWNQRPRDLANLADFIGEGIERELHWQITNEERPVEEWLEAPILYLSGSDTLSLSEDLKLKLRDYVQRGGLIVLNADCGRRGFGDSARRLFEELFSGYTFRVLENDHPIYKQQYNLSTARRVPQILGLSNGARELVLLIDSQDLGRDWQLRRDETTMQLGANLYLYSVDRDGMTAKGISHWVNQDESKQPSKTVAVGRVKYDGNWNPEPAGWDRLAAVLHNDYDTALSVRPVDPAADDLAGLDVLHLTGTEAFTLSETARQGLRAFVDDGGMLFLDAAGGSSTFADATEEQLGALFDDAAIAQLTQPIPVDDPLFADQDKLPPLKISYRLDARLALGNVREPLLRVIEQDDRRAVVWSPHDLSVGLVGMPRAGILGYTPDTATSLVARLLSEQAR